MDAMCMTMILPVEAADLCYSAADHLISPASDGFQSNRFVDAHHRENRLRYGVECVCAFASRKGYASVWNPLATYRRRVVLSMAEDTSE
jgi:hypothetical protein